MRENENPLQCDLCETWIHLAIILILLIAKSFITKLNHGIIFVATVQYDSNMNHSIPVEKNIEYLVLNQPQNLSLLFN